MKWLLYISILICWGIRSKADQDWWKHAVFYQVYPRSFKDSDGDGVGDIKGIIEKVNHFKDAGVDAIWLSPIYKSPQVDQGYDISDFKAIDEQYGTMDDFKELLQKAHDLGVKVIMDFVPNHSSNQHEWFIKSENKTDGYEDYYVWRDAPNNWISSFKGSAWTYSETRKQYYYHMYAPEQPDLNYRNENVVKEMKDVMKFWLDVGIDGFRIDAVGNLFEDAEFRDDPLSGTEGATEEDFEYLDHVYTKHLPETLDMVHQFRELVDDYTQTNGGDARVIMTEVYADILNTMKYYGTEDGSELRAHFTFNFQLITKLNSNSTARDIVDAINEWLDYMPLAYTANWVLGNHDNHRVASRFGPQNVDGFNMLAAFLPGVQVTYNGEEIGQEDGDVTFQQGQDPSACKNNETFTEVSRDFERTPYQWDKTKNAGFSDGDKSWLPVSEKYLETNLADQSIDGVSSHYHVYQDLIELRKEPTFERGKLKILAVSDNVIAFSRSVQGQDTYVCLFNMGDISENLNLNNLFGFNDARFEISIASVNSTFKKGSLYNATDVTIHPHESIVARIIISGDRDWWKHAVIYEIYPRSFKDSDSDGVGDLKGIISKVQHFQNLGVDAIWLSSIYKSPQGHHDYYVSDYKEIDQDLGTMEDFEELVEIIHEVGIKLIIEFVPNHSSNEHNWFELSENRTEGYDDFYVWKDAVNGTEPNNWLSIDEGSAWTWSEKRRQYYLHRYTPQQPDLNYRSEGLVKEIKNILIFWLNKGVDGFTMDSASLLFEESEFKDEPLLGTAEGSYDDLDHIYTEHQPETLDMIYQFRELFDNYTAYNGGDSRILTTKVYSDLPKTMLYYGTDDGFRLGAHFTFNFQLVKQVDPDSDARHFVDTIISWMDYMPLQYTANWMTGDHNNHRIGTRFGKENVDGINMLVTLLPGVQITYSGEEIGMEDGEVTYEEGDDPSGCKNETSFNELSRDFERTPYHWDSTKNSGFSESDKTLLPVSMKYLETNLADESVEGSNSHYHVYQELLRLRQREPFKSGGLKIVAVSSDVLAISRTLQGYDPHIIIFNLGSNSNVFNLSEVFSFTTERIEVILSSTDSSFSKGSLYPVYDLEIKPHESLVARVIQKGSDDWWKHAVFYQVYVRSFKDSDGDGIGDLKGITNNVKHFPTSEVNAILLSSIYKSSHVDQGYDISDFRDIDVEYGTLEDFEELLKTAHELGIKVIMDFIPNHSSNQHEWFNLSENRVEGYEDYYVWKDPVNGTVPNNWLSKFKDSAWEYSETRKGYYLHQFSVQEPDLNYRSNAVVQAMMDIMQFWLDKGIDGFNMDTVPYLFEHEEFKDEPLSGENVDTNDYSYLNHIYTKNQKETFDMIYRFREFLDSYTQYHGGDARVLLVEADTDVEDTILYYGTDDGATVGAHFAFNFQLIEKLDDSSTARDVVDAVNQWIDYLPLQYTANWILGNHNNHRVATRFGSHNLDGFNMLAALLPGVQITYNGEEIGMEDGEVTFEEGVDVGACEDESCFNEKSRDFERTPYHWSRNKNAGFSDGDHTWLPVSKNYLEINLADENVDGIVSHYHVYQDLVRLRTMDSFAYGKLNIKAVSSNILAFTRHYVGDEVYICAFNMGDEAEEINLVEIFNFGPSVQVLVTSVGSTLDVWTVYDATKVKIYAHESFVGVFTEESPNTTTTTENTSTSTAVNTTTTPDTTSAPSSTTADPDEESSGDRLFATYTLLFFMLALVMH